MAEFVLLDSGPLGLACGRPGSPAPDRCRRWIGDLLARGVEVIVPEIADYEVRRELTRVAAYPSLQRLDQLVAPGRLSYAPITTAEWRQATVFWAAARRGVPTASRLRPRWRRHTRGMRHDDRSARRCCDHRHDECRAPGTLLRRKAVDFHHLIAARHRAARGSLAGWQGLGIPAPVLADYQVETVPRRHHRETPAMNRGMTTFLIAALALVGAAGAALADPPGPEDLADRLGRARLPAARGRRQDLHPPGLRRLPRSWS